MSAARLEPQYRWVASPGPSGTFFQMGNADGINTVLKPDGIWATAVLEQQASNGTPDYPTALTTGRTIGEWQVGGFDGTSWQADAGSVSWQALSNWSVGSTAGYVAD